MKSLNIYILFSLLLPALSIFSNDVNEKDLRKIDDALGCGDRLVSFAQQLDACPDDDEDFANVTNVIAFPLSEGRSIELVHSSDKEKISNEDFCKFIFCKDNKKYILKAGFLDSTLRDFRLCLKYAIEGKKELHSSIKKDIGFLRNEYGHTDDIKDLAFRTSLFGLEVWLGEDFSVFSPLFSPENLETWIYTKNNEIFLEITSFYKRLQKNKKIESYEEFIQNYKPLDIIKIDDKTAKQMFEKFDELYRIVISNAPEKYKKNYSFFLDPDANKNNPDFDEDDEDEDDWDE